MKVSVVITTYDGWRFLQACLPAVLGSALPPGWELEVIVVDNGSKDGTPERLAAFPTVKALIFDRPLGFAGANNAARTVATGEVVVFLNNDTVVEPGWLLRPLAILGGDPSVVAVGSKLVFLHRFIRVSFEPPPGGRVRVAREIFGGPLDDKVRWAPKVPGEQVVAGERGRWLSRGDALYLPMPIPGLDETPAQTPTLRLIGSSSAGPIGVHVAQGAVRRLAGAPSIVAVRLDPAEATVRLVQNAGSFITPLGDAGDFGSCVEDRPGLLDREELVPALCGGALFARRPELDKAGWFPRYYHSYYEDVDLCLRLRRNGGGLVFCPSSVVGHYHTGTNRENSPGFIENVARSSLLFVSQHGSPGLLGQKLLDRAGHVARELLGAGPGWPPTIWRQVHGTRGALKALPGLGAMGLERSLSRLKGQASRVDLFATSRQPYASP